MSLHEAFYTLPIKEWFMRKVRHRKKKFLPAKRYKIWRPVTEAIFRRDTE